VYEDQPGPDRVAAGISGGVCVNHLWPVVAGGGGMKDEALKLALDDLILEYHMETSSFAKRVNEIFKQALAAPVQPVPWSQALESVWAEPDDTPPAAQPAVQEPVAWEDVLGAIARGWTYPENVRKPMDVELAVAIAKEIQDMYTTPPAAQRQWVGLTDEEIIDVIHPLVMADMPDEATDYEIARAIEAKLKEKNNG
jgi:hypothetical protein